MSRCYHLWNATGWVHVIICDLLVKLLYLFGFLSLFSSFDRVQKSFQIFRSVWCSLTRKMTHFHKIIFFCYILKNFNDSMNKIWRHFRFPRFRFTYKLTKLKISNNEITLISLQKETYKKSATKTVFIMHAIFKEKTQEKRSKFQTKEKFVAINQSLKSIVNYAVAI